MTPPPAARAGKIRRIPPPPSPPLHSAANRPKPALRRLFVVSPRF
jgi:hypothetical protein